MHNNLQASVRVEYAFYAGHIAAVRLGLRVGWTVTINLNVTEKSQEVARLASRVSRT
jgi:hypothetical protein